MSETFTFKYEYATDIAGDPELHTSKGTVCIDVGDAEVDIDLPDRFGVSTLYNFSRKDWDRMLDMFNAATADDGSDFNPGRGRHDQRDVQRG